MGGTVPQRACEQKSAVTPVRFVTVVIVVRLHPGLICLAACSLEHGLPLPGGGGGGNPVPDPLGPDAQVMVDAAVSSDAATGDGPCADADNDGVCNAVDDWP